MAHPMESQNSPKWKTFIWRAISDILPTTTNLIIKRVDVDPNCTMCGISQEDTMQALVLCDFAKAIWEQSNIPIPNIMTNVFHIWFIDLLNVLDSNGILHATTILYHIWRARNGVVWDVVLPRPRKLLAMAASMHAWRHARTTAAATPIAEHPGLPLPHKQLTTAAATTAVPLPRNFRIDVGFLHDSGKATVGAMLLDANGGYIAAFSAPLPVCFSPLMAEAFTCKEALSWLKNRGESSVRLYTDCLSLQRYLTSPPSTVRSFVRWLCY
ncbi:PREDICTED: uncharacterized protein LOC109166717 [Ipomoea nil]|uniref:uncharacterized protein LOC109166717 n=1 Tax=Ipomoea nil TaxID=35883 RepID=UPI00090164DD|nr:PREDICTED: uncharacterized protein LOC109166717 [Ipomoea nil]